MPILAIAQAAEWAEEPPFLSTFDSPDYKIWLPEAEPSPGTARELNDLGYDAYMDGDMLTAAAMWKAALLMDRENPWAHYNYAAVLAVFAGGFDGFDAPADELPEAAWDRDDFFDYRVEIINHLKKSVYLRPERMDRLLEDPDLLMGPDPTPGRVLEFAPKWYSLQEGAFLPKDVFTFHQYGSVSFFWDTARFEAFPIVFKDDKTDRSFEGRWRVVNNQIAITTEAGENFNLGFAHIFDGLGFIKKRFLMYGEGKYGDFDAHYWEGQDG